MKDSLFIKIIIITAAVCIVFTLAHLAYAVNAYEHCSIIQFVSRELW